MWPQILLTMLISNAPTQDYCVDAWAAEAAPTRAASEKCIDVLLASAYGPQVDDEALSLDPPNGDPIEFDLTTTELHAIARHVGSICPPRDGKTEDWRCIRAQEYIASMLDRKMSLFEGVEIGGFAALVQRVIDGKKLKRDDFCVDQDVCWSAFTLWKVRNAVYARHGYPFEQEDLNRFFYEPRPNGVEVLEIGDGEQSEVRRNLLPLKRGTNKKVKLTAVDRANLAIIAAHAKRRGITLK
jgi:hypothetical protein